MISQLEEVKSQRKTFTLPYYIVKELESYAHDFETKQSHVIALALEEFLTKQKVTHKVDKRLKALNGLTNIAPKGSLKSLDPKSLRTHKVLNA
jgi:hypothetical protein